MQWVLSLAANVDPLKSIITSTWQGPKATGDQLNQGDSVLIAAVQGVVPVAVFEWLLAHGADKAALDAKQHRLIPGQDEALILGNTTASLHSWM